MLDCFITGFLTGLTRRVPLVEQGLLTLPEHMISPPVFSGVRVTRTLVKYVYVVYIVVCPFVLFLLAETVPKSKRQSQN